MKKIVFTVLTLTLLSSKVLLVQELNLGLTVSPTEKLIFQLRYYQGLRNLNSSDILPDDKRFNVALQLSAGYVIF